MFDIGFWELIVILLVALVVIGPERLPQVARTAGLWLGRMRRMVDTVRADIQRELAAEELKKTLSDESGLSELEETIRKTDAELKEQTQLDPSAADGSPDEAPSAADSPKESAGPGAEAGHESRPEEVVPTAPAEPEEEEPTGRDGGRSGTHGEKV